MPNCKIHNVRFYKPKPKAIYCMSLQKSKRKLAVSRSDASIEIWNLNGAAFIERTIPSSPDNLNIEGLVWCDDRLFSVGLNGFIIEYDLFTLTRKQAVAVTGEAAFCVDINNTKTNIAVGTEQGFLNILSITDEILFEKFLDKQEGRILCLKYDPSGKFIASGSVDAIRVWNVETGHAIHRMTLGRSEANKETIVWCIDILDDLTVISGDSRGKLTFWDGQIGSQLESYQSHRADIVSLCLSDDQKTLYCAGIDPNIMSYVKINVKGENHMWVKSIQRKVHDHDVRSLVLCENKLYSGGIDGYVACSFHPPKTLIKHPPILQNPVTVCSSARYVMLRYNKYIEVWSLGQSLESESQAGLLLLESEPKKLLTLQRRINSGGDKGRKEGILSCSMSDDGKWIVYSTDSIVRLFSFEYNPENAPSLTLLENLPKECIPSVQAAFTSNGSHLILAPRTGGLQVISLRDGLPVIIQKIDTSAFLTDTTTYLMVSPCNQYLVAADPQSNIAVWKLAKNGWHHLCKLPRYQSPPTAISLHPTELNLLAVYADHNIVEYSLKSMKFTKFSKSLGHKLPKKWLSKWFPARTVTFDQRVTNVTIIHDDANIVVIDKEKPLAASDAKIPRIDSAVLSDSNDSLTPHRHTFHAIKKYKHLVYLGWLSNDEMVAVEVNPLSLFEQLPPCLKQHTFGTK